jgi:hypothetical protein
MVVFPDPEPPAIPMISGWPEEPGDGSFTGITLGAPVQDFFGVYASL